MMKNIFIITLFVCASNFAHAQFIETSSSVEQEIGLYPQFSGDRGPAAFQYHSPSLNVKLNVVVWDYTSSGFFWERTVAGVKTSDTVHFGGSDIPRNLDVVVGDSGNKIMIAYQWNYNVTVKVFDWNGTNYSEINSQVVSQNLGTYLFGGPALTIDKNDNVVVGWRSYGASPRQIFLMRSGDIFGNFNSYLNNLNAFVISDSIGSNVIQTESIDIALFTSNANVTTVFCGVAFQADSTKELEQYSMPLLDLNTGVAANVSKLSLRSMPDTSNYIVSVAIAANPDSNHPTYRNPGSGTWNEVQDEWAIATKERNDDQLTNDIVLYKGINGGSFNRYVLTIGDLTKCANQFPSISYCNGIYVGWSHKSCGNQPNLSGAALNGWDAMGTITDDFSGEPKHIIRLNSNSYLLGDQQRVETHTTLVDTANPNNYNVLVVFRNDSSTICFKELRQSLVSNDDASNLLNSIQVYPTLVKTDVIIEASGFGFADKRLAIYNILGQKVYDEPLKLKSQINMLHFTSGIYVVKIQNEADTVIFSKTIIKD